MVAGQVLDGDEPVLLDVETPFESLPEPQRRAYLRAEQLEALEKARVTGGLAHDVGQRQVDAELAGDLAVVERHAGARHAVEVAPLQAVAEDRLPLRQRHAPLGRAREDPVGVGGEAAAHEAGVDVFGDQPEELVDRRVVGVCVGEPVVLVGGQGELAARALPNASQA